MDDHLRELERRWRESSSATDGAAWLVERLRLGRLVAPLLESAAICGDPAARLALRQVERALLTRAVAAGILGLERRVIDRWARKRAPARGSRGRPSVDPIIIIAWLEAEGWRDAGDPLEVLARALHATAPRAEMRFVWATLRAAAGNRQPLATWLANAEAIFEDPSRMPGGASPFGTEAFALAFDFQRSELSHILAACRAARSLEPRATPDEVLAAARRNVVAWALEERPDQASARWSVRVLDHGAHGGPFEYEQTIEHQVVDARTGKVVRTFAEDLWAIPYPGEMSYSGASRVTIDPEGSHAIVEKHDGTVERVPLPG